MGRPESLLRERGRTQPILVGDHHELEIQPLTNEIEVTHHLRDKL